MQTRRAIKNLLRFLIIASAVLIFLEFSDLIWLELHQLDQPFNLFTLSVGIFGPALAIAATVFALINKYLPLAALFAAISLVIFVTPLVVFILG